MQYVEALAIKREMDKWLPMGDPFLSAPLAEKILIYQVLEYGYDTLSKGKNVWTPESTEWQEVKRWLSEYAPELYAMKQAILADPNCTPQIRDAVAAKQWATLNKLTGGAAEAVRQEMQELVEASKPAGPSPLLMAALAIGGFFILGRFLR